VTGTLSLAILSTRSTFKDNVSLEANGSLDCDTVQIWVGSEVTFQIHTYALDQDIRIYAVDSRSGILETLEAIDQKNYGDITTRRIQITFDDTSDQAEVRSKFASHGLEPTVIVEEGAFVFWRFGDTQYRTISEPMPPMLDIEGPDIVLKGTFLLSILGVRGNYHEGLYLDAEGNPESDTSQWWIMDEETYGTLTFAMIRTMRSIHFAKPAEEMFRLAEESQQRFVASVTKEVRIDFDNIYDFDEVETKFKEVGLEASIRMYLNRIPIWTYHGIEYAFDNQDKATPIQMVKQKLVTPIRHWFNSRG
jgi:hypothetical protein